ncbi:MAG: WbqC family protein [Balneolaceae bacterium]|nr:WbqC family protein [Balneolaceae bacterium]
MTLALLYPQLAPNLYDLALMMRADRVVLLDTETWSRKSRIHRTRIRTPQGTQWINIPVRTDDRDKPVRAVRIDHAEEWATPLLRSLTYNYRNSPYFDFYEPEIRADFEAAADFEFLMPFVLHVQERLLRFMEHPVHYDLAFGLEDYTSDPDELARRLGADRLWQEHDSRHYMRQAENATVLPGFRHPRYRQHFEGFEPWCGLFDLLFQFGPESFKITDRIRESA